MRACSICNQPKHNSRTCPKRPSNNISPKTIGKSADPVNLEEKHAAPEVTPILESTVVPASPIQITKEEIAFNENTIQEYIGGLAVRLAYREYQGGGTLISLKVTTEAQITKEIQLDVPGAAKLLHMLTSILQKHYVLQQQKRAIATTPIAYVDPSYNWETASAD